MPTMGNTQEHDYFLISGIRVPALRDCANAGILCKQSGRAERVDKNRLVNQALQIINT